MNAETPRSALPPLVPPPMPALAPDPEAARAQFAGKSPLSCLLQSPLALIDRIERGEDLVRITVLVLAVGLLCHALYGFAMGLFGGWTAAWMTAAKAPLIALGSIALCVPSLFVFSAVGGLPLRFSQAVAFGACVVGMIGFLLLGLAPVAWLFAVSTESLAFTVLLNAAAWFVAVGFALRFIGHLRWSRTLRSTAGIKGWVFVYVLVTLQMGTAMRPLLEPPKNGWWQNDKKFFLAHFVECMDGKD